MKNTAKLAKTFHSMRLLNRVTRYNLFMTKGINGKLIESELNLILKETATALFESENEDQRYLADVIEKHFEVIKIDDICHENDDDIMNAINQQKDDFLNKIITLYREELIEKLESSTAYN